MPEWGRSARHRVDRPRRRRARAVRWVAPLAVLVALLSASRRAHAWIISEHNRLTHAAFEALPRPYRDTLLAAWQQARLHQGWSQRRLHRLLHAPHLVELDDDGDWRISFSSLPALAADHSCSPANLTSIIAHEPWLLGVLRRGLEVEETLAGIDDPEDRYDERRLLDIRLQFEDEDYLGRAKVNSAHFLPARTSATLTGYLRDALATGATSNAVGIYLGFHAAALAEADRAAACSDPPASSARPCQQKLWRALLLEAFALHFLQDAFSSGHMVGSWGDLSQRKGTHDYYCRYGLDVATWEGDSYAAYGDGYLSDEDVRRAATASVRSLRQLALVLTPEGERKPKDAARAGAIVSAVRRLHPVGELDVCTSAAVPAGLEELASAAWVHELMAAWPRPPSRIPALPRMRTEIGFFFSGSIFAGGAALAPLDGGDAEGEVSAQLGIGLGGSTDGILPAAGYGRYYAEAIVGSLHNFAREEAAMGIGFAVDLPFAVVPGDWPLVLLLSGCWHLGWPAEQLARGGWIPIFRPYSPTETTRIQLVAGRQMTMLWFPAHGTGAARRPLRYQIRVPAFELALGDRFHQRIGQEWVLGGGLQYDHLGGGEHAVGGYGALGLRMRTFP